MRPRRREINIFNMSLLDILCGALGAFCFMMLVTLPDYRYGRPTSDAQLAEQQKKTEELMQELKTLKGTMSDSEAAQKMAQVIQQLEAEVKQVQGQLVTAREDLTQARVRTAALQQQNEKFAAQTQQLTAQNEQLTAQNQKLDATVRMRNPFLVTVASSDRSQGLDLYLEDDHIAGGVRNPPFDPQKKRHTRFWPGDISTQTATGFSAFLIRDSPAGIHYKIFVKLMSEPEQRNSVSVSGGVYGEGMAISLPEFGLTPERPWALVGTLTGQEGGQQQFAPAPDLPKLPTAEDIRRDQKRIRDEARRRAGEGGRIPLLTPERATPGPSQGSPPAFPLSPERMKELQRLRAATPTPGLPGPTPAASTVPR